MTDYSQASEVVTETVEMPVIITFTTRGHDTVVEWEYPEFQCLCPISQRHDQGVVKLRYAPRNRILESKSVRDYFMQWRNKRTWQEYVTDEIAEVLFKAAEPRWLTVEIQWSPRGGIAAKTCAKRGDMD
jgi:7-cyano-7-deazaguanine reductase